MQKSPTYQAFECALNLSTEKCRWHLWGKSEIILSKGEGKGKEEEGKLDWHYCLFVYALDLRVAKYFDCDNDSRTLFPGFHRTHILLQRFFFKCLSKLYVRTSEIITKAGKARKWEERNKGPFHGFTSG